MFYLQGHSRRIICEASGWSVCFCFDVPMKVSEMKALDRYRQYMVVLIVTLFWLMIVIIQLSLKLF